MFLEEEVEGGIQIVNDLEKLRADDHAIASAPDEVSSFEKPVSLRVSPQGYFTALLLGTFTSAFLFYLEIDIPAVIVFALSWILIPFFAVRDRLEFDGKRLIRIGLVPRVWNWFSTSRRSLKVADIEQVETQAIRTIKRGGHVHYRYRTVLRGKGVSVAFSSGASGVSEDYRQMIKTILARLSDNILDTRSVEVRDHLADPKETLMRAEFARIPAADVLENSLRAERRIPREATESEEDEKADDLLSLANELRLSGYLVQALEAFRRALVLKPRDARMIFDFARCLHSFAGSTRDAKLERRALAAIRLSEQRAADDGALLVRLGEWYFQIGEWRRAGTAFQNAVERIGENFRAARGLAEIALRDGKIAHVIHHFSAANRIAETPSLRRWSKNEAEYFSNLNSDDEYMELEISRVNLLETIERSKKTALKLAFFGFPAIIVGILLEDGLIANVGWAVSTASLLIWTGLIMSSRLLAQRIPYEMIGSDD